MATASAAVLTRILSDETLRNAYMDFCRKEHSEENVITVDHLRCFDSCPDDVTRLHHAREVHKLLQSGTINVASKLGARLDAVLTPVSTPTAAGDGAETTLDMTALSHAFQELKATMTREVVADSLPRFLHSSIYKQLQESISSSCSRRVSMRPATAQPLLVLALESPSERKTTLLALLDHPFTRACFVEFCKMEHNEENVEVLLTIRDFRRPMPVEDRKAQAKVILNTYIRAGSRSEANIDSHTRMLAEVFLTGIMHHGFLDVGDDSAGGAPADALAKVEMELINMLSGEVLPRFATSKLWLEFVVAHSPRDAAADGSSGTLKPVSGWRRMLGVSSKEAVADIKGEDCDANRAHKAHDPVATLRDKIYLFGMSVKPSLLGFGSSKKAEIEALGTEIKATQVRAGYIFKRAHHKASWKRRWFVLTPTMLAYYDAPSATVPNGVMLLKEVTDISLDWPRDPSFFAEEAAKSKRHLVTPGKIEEVLEDVPADVQAMSYVFCVNTPHRPYTFQGSSDKDRARWIFAINAAKRGDLEAAKNADVALALSSTPVDSFSCRILKTGVAPSHVPIGTATCLTPHTESTSSCESTEH